MNNEHEGKGGSYVVGEDGEHKLVERTKERSEAPPEDPAPAAATKSKAAKAAFSSPDAPADQSTKE